MLEEENELQQIQNKVLGLKSNIEKGIVKNEYKHDDSATSLRYPDGLNSERHRPSSMSMREFKDFKSFLHPKEPDSSMSVKLMPMKREVEEPPKDINEIPDSH